MKDEEFSAWLGDRRGELAALNEDIKEWWRRTEKAPAEQKESDETWNRYVQNSGGAEMFRRAEERLVALSEVYLEASRERRRDIRRTLEGLNAVLGLALSVPGTLARHIKTSDDVRPLRIALAAASIQDSRIDFRGLMACLDQVYTAARGAGIDPQPHFREVGELSSRQPAGPAAWSVCELLCNYHRRFERDDGA